jgi:hypothetical protein
MLQISLSWSTVCSCNMKAYSFCHYTGNLMFNNCILVFIFLFREYCISIKWNLKVWSFCHYSENSKPNLCGLNIHCFVICLQHCNCTFYWQHWNQWSETCKLQEPLKAEGTYTAWSQISGWIWGPVTFYSEHRQNMNPVYSTTISHIQVSLHGLMTSMWARLVMQDMCHTQVHPTLVTACRQKKTLNTGKAAMQ